MSLHGRLNSNYVFALEKEKNMRKLICTLLAILLIFNLSVFAYAQQTSYINVQTNNDFVYVDGQFLSVYDKILSFVLSKDGAVISLGQAPLNINNGKFEFEIELDRSCESGTYLISVSTAKIDEILTKEFEFKSYSERIAVLTLINNGATAQEILDSSKNEEYCKLYRAFNCFVDDYIALSDDSLKLKAASFISNGFNGEYTKPYTEENLNEVFNVSLAHVILTDEKNIPVSDTLKKYASVFGIDPETVVESELLSTRMRKAKYALGSVSDLLQEVNILTEINAVLDYSQMYDVIKKHNDILKLDLTEYSNNKTKVSKALTGKNFSYITEITSAVKTALEKPDSNSGSIGGGGGNGGTVGAPAGNVTNKDEIFAVSGIESDSNENVKAIPFSDIESVEWAKEEIVALYNKNIINGVDDKHFEPTREITRAEFAKILVNAFKMADTTATCDFVDMDKNEWSYVYVASLIKSGIANGIGDNLFGKNQLITRQDVCVLVDRVAKKLSIRLGNKMDIVYPDDIEVLDPYAIDSVKNLYAAGIVNGYTTGLFEGDKPINRAEAAKVIYSVMKIGGFN